MIERQALALFPLANGMITPLDCAGIGLEWDEDKIARCRLA